MDARLKGITNKVKAHLIPATSASDATKMSLEDMIKEADKYGELSLRTFGDMCRYACINMSNVPGINLEASSKFDHKTWEEALELCLKRAKKITASFK